MQGWIACGRITFSAAPNITKYPEEYNRLLLSTAFRKSIKGEHVLIFQTDTVLCRASPHAVDDFLQYDHIGAPWASAPHLPCGNNGLSLRTKSKALQVLGVEPLDETVPEGVWYCSVLTLAHANVSTALAVESLFYPQPFGLHKFHVFFGGAERRRLLAFGPEARILLPLRPALRVVSWWKAVGG